MADATRVQEAEEYMENVIESGAEFNHKRKREILSILGHFDGEGDE